MQYRNVKLIYLREMRDQLRDRRTLFLIAVLPLLLYPLLGTSFFQLTQFLQKVEARVLVVGARQLRTAEWLPPLVDGNQFATKLFDQPELRDKILLYSPRDYPEYADALRKGKSLPVPGKAAVESPDEVAFDAAATALLDAGKVEAVLVFPNGFEDRLSEVRRALVERKSADAAAFPEPIILYNSSDDKSQVTQLRVQQILRNWRNEVTAENLSASNVPVEATTPFELRPRDLAQMQQRQAAVWSKVLPFFVFIWALTGAFYPAVDLCAGEKERGTLETLLTSPALRREIVWGKLLTVMTFSAVTAALNLGSLGLTGKFVIDNLSKSGAFDAAAETMTMPPASSLVALAVALIPISALFSALCLACAAFARSTKEGQYYLMPIMLVTMPLMMLPMSPGVELNLGNSFIPVTGMVLLLRSVIEGQYGVALKFVWPVLGVTTVCCLLAIRWAEEQFNRESVLFRESERLELGRWLVHLVKDRQSTPSFAQAALCVAIILITQFFISLSATFTGELDFAFLAKSLLVSQLACIFAPTMLMTIMLTRDPAKTLLLERTPRWRHLVGMVALAVALHPVVVVAANQVTKVYPVPEATEQFAESIGSALDGAPHWLVALALMALLPAVCEELAFRGFILSGFRHVGHKWWAIALSAVAFGLVHTFLHQKISATMMGMIIGYVAVQTESIWPCILLHTVHNSLQLTAHKLAELVAQRPDSPLAVLFGGESPLLYRTPTVIACGLAAAAILWSLHGMKYSRTPEELLEEARRRRDSSTSAA
jgi:sodium transport system permease protein